ncbi:cation diffusion facilitator family transporter [Endozoicomonas ascidiicola]|uniref:cation diffusion facilitator family transporter n=1 Tax=Endozoicomonas ascidiicola TaxID=1698521 RepID=UPI00082F5114|nr:cation diffusion facilitator family transporter [Endozoicomonas ascidiicola]
MAQHVHHCVGDNDSKLCVAIIIKLALSGVQMLGGSLSGSLCLIADALHNLGDSGSILLALIARKVGRKAPDSHMTFGYCRADILGGLANSLILLAVGVYLIVEAAEKYFSPADVDGWVVLWIAGVALLVNTATAVLTYLTGARGSININAVFIHSASDSVASLVVIIAAVFMINYQLHIFDVIATLGISIYVLFNGTKLFRRCISILMQGVPKGINIDRVKLKIGELDGIEQVEQLHIWQLDDRHLFCDAIIVCKGEIQETVKEEVREFMGQRYAIRNCTLETRVI